MPRKTRRVRRKTQPVLSLAVQLIKTHQKKEAARAKRLTRLVVKLIKRIPKTPPPMTAPPTIASSLPKPIASTHKTTLDAVLAIPPAGTTEQILDAHQQPFGALPGPTTTKISVVEQDTLDAAAGLDNVVVLNFANAFTPGGDARTQAHSQEELLCHCSNLLVYLEQASDKYPMPEYSLLYSAQVDVVFKATGGTFEPLAAPFRVAVISAAAADLDDRERSYAPDQGYELPATGAAMRARMEGVLRTAANKGHKNIVLGAWGCGSFGHPPVGVAKLWHELLLESEFVDVFENVVFALLPDALTAFQTTFAE